jgi:4-diphosphocytidyl-2-C-methyl-D-erythritol kinase
MFTLLAPAKINLTLEILSRRDDGYHNLRSLMAPVGLHDRITLEPAPAASFVSNVPELSENNIIARALAAAGVSAPLRISLEKRIPVGGGLGGGSGDAAAVLRAAMDGVFGTIHERNWIETARALGSDVPFFLLGSAGLVEGTGERITSVGKTPAWWALIVRPSVAVATADAYRLLAASRTAGAPSRPRATSATLAAADALQRGDFAALQERLVNDFHDLILAAYPRVAQAHAAMRAAGAARALLSGSGSCLFALFPDEPAARAVDGKLARGNAIEDVFVAPLLTGEAWS